MQLPLMKRDKAAKIVLFRVLGRAPKDKLSGKQRATAGQALQGQMLHAALKAGVEIRLQSPVKELIVANGRVTGVVQAVDESNVAKIGRGSRGARVGQSAEISVVAGSKKKKKNE